MAIYHDETNDYWTLALSNDLDFPDSDWSIGFWLRQDNNDGSAWQYLFGNRNGANFSSNVGAFIVEASNGYSDERMKFNIIRDDTAAIIDSATVGAGVSNDVIGGDNIHRLWIFQRRGADYEMWSCEVNKKPREQARTTPSNWAAINNGQSWEICRRKDANADRYYGGELSEFFKADFSLSVDEIAEMGRGKRINEIDKFPLKMYVPMDVSNSTLVDESTFDHTWTRQSTPYTVDHPPTAKIFDFKKLQVAAGTEILATTDALTLTTYQATINAETSISANVDALTLTENQANINSEKNVNANVHALTLTEFPASISAGLNIGANVHALTLTENAATINAENNVNANIDNLVIATFAASITLPSGGTNVLTNVHNLTLTGNAATINAAKNIICSTDALIITSNVVNISTGVSPTSEGMQYTINGNLIHYSIDGRLLHYTTYEEKIHYTMKA